MLTSITGTNLFYRNYWMMMEDIHGYRASVNLLYAQEAAATSRNGNPMVFAATVGRIAQEAIRANPGQYLATTLRRHVRLYTRPPTVDILAILGDEAGGVALEASFHDWRVWWKAPRVTVLNSLCVLLQFSLYAAMLGLFTLASLQRWKPVVLTTAVLLYFAAIIGPNVETRYRLVMLPAFALLASTGLRLPERPPNSFPPRTE